jgi:hypothetical protein
VGGQRAQRAGLRLASLVRKIGVVLVREHTKVGSAAAQADWPRRARRANAMGGVVGGAV